MSDLTQGEAPPISVKRHARSAVMSETTKAVMLVGFAFAADHFLRSDITKGAVVAVSGILATFVWGLWHRMRTYFALRFLANAAPDHVAKVGE